MALCCLPPRCWPVVLWVLVASAHQGDQDKVTNLEDVGACPTTVTASTTVGFSLIQAVKGRTKLASRTEDSISVKQVLGSSKKELFKASTKQQSSGPEQVEDGKSFTSLLVERGREAAQSVTSCIHGILPTSFVEVWSEVLGSKGAIMFAVFLMISLAVFLVVVLTRPSSNNQRRNPLAGIERPTEQLLSRSTSSTTRTPQFPAGAAPASPQLSIRSASRPTPEAARRQLPTVDQASKLSMSNMPLKENMESRMSRNTFGAPPPLPTSDRQAQFCPDLIVPQHCECILVLPLDLAAKQSSFAITDTNGSQVLRVMPQPAADGRAWRAYVTTSTGEGLVNCQESRPASGRADTEYHLIRTGGDHYAKMTFSPAQDRYLLTLQNGSTIHFWGNFETSAVNITDDENRLLATTEIGSSDDLKESFCRLRVAPLADVGMALCGLLCIAQHMRAGNKTASV